ncbi:hypothetical protein [Abyssalbus ytuae]|uniref:Uncharacterized protein n=1 Tax=Abyssalbus ytuae TaxID=2926907 RepID=A0A9E6ZKF0_9FLAO|nr:hypothetical protein [Abyssalbus ytuae]UOB17327.1 hypothetical protein MQE35_16520 [Abyssalbus ytuae]
MEEKVLQLVTYALPTIITGVIAYYFFNQHTKNEEGRRRYLLQKEAQKDALPLRLQAYERMTLFLERINPAKLLIRVAPDSTDKDNYEATLISHIENEFDHNLTQQIYMTDDCWTIIKAAKNATIQLIRKAAMNSDSADKLRETILNELLEKEPPSNAALGFVKKEITELW